MGDKGDNFKGMMSNPKNRNVFMATGVVALLTIGGGIVMLSNKDKGNAAPPSQVGALPQMEKEGFSKSTTYNELVKEENKSQVGNALRNDQNFIPTLTNNGSKTNIEDISQKEPEVIAPVTPVDLPVVIPETTKMVEMPVASTSAPVLKKVKADEYGYDDVVLLKALTGMWAVKKSSMEIDVASKAPEKESEGDSASSGSSSASPAPAAIPSAPVYKAGDILNAILETGINSDEPSPVLAKVVTGKFKGARLIGQVNRVGKKMLVQFTSISVNGIPTSLPINAVAIDPNTSRTAVASSVNNHYFQKYATLAATSFIKGYAVALSTQNSIVTKDPFGGTTTSNGPMSSKQAVTQGAGEVAAELSEDFKKNGDRPPTVTVEEGLGIGILIMSDFYAK